jgi:hypothetical protein
MASYLREGGADSHLASVLYLGAFEGMSIAFTLIFWWAIRHEHMRVPLPPADARRASIRFGIGQVGYIAAIGVCFVSAPVALILSAVVAVYYVFEQTPRRGSEPA